MGKNNIPYKYLSHRSTILIIILLGLSLLMNIMVIVLDTIPFIYHRYKKETVAIDKSILMSENRERTIVDCAITMARSDEIIMVWKEQASFTEGLLNLRNIVTDQTFKQYNYPRGFLISGLTEYAKSKNDSVLMSEVADIFNKYINNEGLPKFTFDKVDQVPFGVASINLYQFTNDIRYKTFADYIYNKLLATQEENGEIILYRNGQKQQLCDVLGMICPFLIKYDEIFGNVTASRLAQKQLNYYIKYGVDKETYLPSHGIYLNNKIKIGPLNWGRGIGWYIIALSDYVKHKGTYRMELDALISTLNELKTAEFLWTQFPGLSDQFDASATIMFMYAINLAQPKTYLREDVFKLLRKYIDYKGKILCTSGDTYGINDYSKTFGDSELSQGMLLMLLSTCENPN